MKRSSAGIRLLLLLLLLVPFNNCSGYQFEGIRGQDIIVGNPLTSFSLRSLRLICETLVKCNPGLTQIQCQTGVMATGGVGEAMGLPAGIYTQFSDVVAGENSGVVVETSASGSSCLGDLGNIASTPSSCSAPEVKAAYDLNLSNPFSKVPGMIPSNAGSCPTALSDKTASLAVTSINATSPVASSQMSQTGPGIYAYSVPYSLKNTGTASLIRFPVRLEVFSPGTYGTSGAVPTSTGTCVGYASPGLTSNSDFISSLSAVFQSGFGIYTLRLCSGSWDCSATGNNGNWDSCKSMQIDFPN